MSEKSAIETCIELAALSPHKAMTGEIVPNARLELSEMRAEIEGHDALISMQHKRTIVADKLWQEATGYYDTFPDLGVLIEWLMAQAEGWIAVADDLPQMEEPVWLYFSGQAPFIGCRTDDVDGWLWANCYDDYYFDKGKWKTETAEVDDDYQPTHWKRLPSPPLDIVPKEV